ncbi:hypothetical protein LEP1GSC052_0159 [Leptospira kmetyi serovar Malaysia str. Bejo-Iso9]|nr:hypothetical protein LEP1GSC052_0159 [Leptospira kmetyi serovar Malaysia str. Bejo-Iso9]
MEKREEFSVCSKGLPRERISERGKPSERLQRFVDIDLSGSEARE